MGDDLSKGFTTSEEPRSAHFSLPDKSRMTGDIISKLWPPQRKKQALLFSCRNLKYWVCACKHMHLGHTHRQGCVVLETPVHLLHCSPEHWLELHLVLIWLCGLFETSSQCSPSSSRSSCCSSFNSSTQSRSGRMQWEVFTPHNQGSAAQLWKCYEGKEMSSSNGIKHVRCGQKIRKGIKDPWGLASWVLFWSLLSFHMYPCDIA